ncbi:zinc finger protein [Trifolium repens]|nr:zinc finger protein [Trifolium repens]
MVNHSILIFVSFFSFIVAFPSCAQSSSFNLYGNWKLWYIIHFIYFCLSIFILLYSPSRLWRRARLISVLIITSLSVLITSLYSYLFHKQDVFSYIAVGIFISTSISCLGRIRYNSDVKDIWLNLGNLRAVEDMEFGGIDFRRRREFVRTRIERMDVYDEEFRRFRRRIDLRRRRDLRRIIEEDFLWNIIPYIYFSLSIFLSCVLSSSFYSTNRRGIFSMMSSQMPTLQIMDLKYNEFDQPVCRVCEVVLKSESLWDAHQVSRKHREAISNLKANAAGLTKQNNAKPDVPKAKPEQSSSSQFKRPRSPQEVPKPQSSSVLPPDFFDNNDAKKARSEKDLDSDLGASTQSSVSNSKEKDHFHGNNTTQSKVNQATVEAKQTSVKTIDAEIKQGKGALPEGFFDNKEADLRARGIKLVKPDVKDEYKEFEKLIQEDLREVDDRLEEEEIDAAEMIEEAESAEQKNLKEKVEMLKRKRLELKASKSAKLSKSSSDVVTKESRHEDSSSDDESGENFAVDWRAQHL